MEDLNETLDRTNRIWQGAGDKEILVQSFGFDNIKEFIGWVYDMKRSQEDAFQTYLLSFIAQGPEAYSDPSAAPKDHTEMMHDFLSTAMLYAESDVILASMILARERTIIEK